MTDGPYVLDASAILTAFFDEAGADVVVERMSGALLSAVNYHEVVANLVDRGTLADQILDFMLQLDVEIVSVDQVRPRLPASCGPSPAPRIVVRRPVLPRARQKPEGSRGHRRPSVARRRRDDGD